ncbi:uncharacterized protein LOC136071748 [Hydra vulgaris]|uniref:uncharacterized protein LOC136071748 n=1 Tax=Hydra vulgaris TaxID=6087 RepID=UPI0032E9EB24
MSSQDTEGNEEVSAFFRKKLEDFVENLNKQFVIHFTFKKKGVFYGLLAFLIQFLAFFFIGLIFQQLKNLENSIASSAVPSAPMSSYAVPSASISSAVPSGNVFCILMQFYGFYVY